MPLPVLSITTERTVTHIAKRAVQAVWISTSGRDPANGMVSISLGLQAITVFLGDPDEARDIHAAILEALGWDQGLHSYAHPNSPGEPS